LGNQIELLVDLQTVDQQLRDRTEAIDALRRQAAELQAELDEQRKVLEATRAERVALESRRRELEGMLSDEESKMKDRRMRLSRIRNEKEAAAVRREIELGKEGNQKLEEELLTCFEALDGVTARESETQTTFDALHQRRSEQQTFVDAEIGTLSNGLDEARQRRAQLAAAVDGDLRRKYETIFVKRRGVAVVEVRGGSCVGCHMRVAPQLFNEIQRNQRVISCPNCNRILYCRPEPVASEA